MTTSSPKPRKPVAGRRQFLAAAGAFGVMAGMPPMAWALSPDDAARLVNDLSTELGQLSGQSAATIAPRFEQILDRYADMPIIAQSVLGVEWRSASQAQRDAFTRAFRGYVARKYGARFGEFQGGSIAVTEARTIRSFVEVRSRASLPGQSPVEVIWLVSDGSGRARVFNLLIEGVDLRTTESQEIGAMLDAAGGNLDDLVARLSSAP